MSRTALVLCGLVMLMVTSVVHVRTQSAGTLKISQWLQVARCRARCVNRLIRSHGNTTQLRELSNKDCFDSESCRGCWELCYNLEKDTLVWQAVCQKKDLCRSAVKEGCQAACDFKYNASWSETSSSHGKVARSVTRLLLFTVSHLNQLVVQVEHKDNRSSAAVFWLTMKHRFSDEWTSATQSLSRRLELEWNEAVSLTLFVFQVLVVRESVGVDGRSDECDLQGCGVEALGTRRPEGEGPVLAHTVVALVAVSSSLCVFSIAVAVLVFLFRSRRPTVQLIREASMRRVRSVRHWASRSMKKRADEYDSAHPAAQILEMAAGEPSVLSLNEEPLKNNRFVRSDASPQTSITDAFDNELLQSSNL